MLVGDHAIAFGAEVRDIVLFVLLGAGAHAECRDEKPGGGDADAQLANQSINVFEGRLLTVSPWRAPFSHGSQRDVGRMDSQPSPARQREGSEASPTRRRHPNQYQEKSDSRAGSRDCCFGRAPAIQSTG